MFCLFLGLSLSFLTAQTVNLSLQCWRFSAAFKEWLAIKPILDNYTFPHPLVSGYPCRTARSAQSPLAHP